MSFTVTTRGLEPTDNKPQRVKAIYPGGSTLVEPYQTHESQLAGVERHMEVAAKLVMNVEGWERGEFTIQHIKSEANAMHFRVFRNVQR